MRKRTLDGSLFFKTVLFDHLCYDQSSLEFHSSSIHCQPGLKISKQGLDKRFNDKAVSFWACILERYLANRVGNLDLSSSLKSRFKSVRIMDSTNFKLHPSLYEAFPGFGGEGTKACAQIQFEFDLFSGLISNLSLSHALVSDVAYGLKSMDNLKPGELLLRDLGYYNLHTYRRIAEQGAFFISRLKSQISIYEYKQGQYKVLTHKQIIQRLKRSKKQYLDMSVYIGREEKFKVRMLANLLEDSAVEHRLKRMKRRKTRLNDRDRVTVQVNLLITNIEDTAICADQIYSLYRLRWQIELVFKAWKSVLKIHRFGKMKAHRLKCYLYAKLLWVMVSWEIYQCGYRQVWSRTKRMLSVIKVYQQIKLHAHKLRALMDQGNGSYEQWLRSVLFLSENYALKDNKKGKIKVEDILCLS